MTFHRLVPDEVKYLQFPKYRYVGRIKIFEEMMDYLFNNGYKTITTKEFYKWYKGEIEFYGKTVMITIDDGKYEDYYLAYPIIKKYKFKATSFIVGSRINNETKKYNMTEINFIGLDIINKIRKEYPNYEFQSHSYDMHIKINNTAKLFLMTEKELQEDIENNKKFNFTCMAYPYGYYNDKIKYVLYNSNYSFAFAFGKNKLASRDDDRFSIPRINLNGECDLNSLKKWLKY